MKAIPQISVDSQVIIARLKTMKKGDVITYDEMSKLIQSDIRRASYYCLNTARKRLLADDGMVFEAVRGIGIKRMDDEQIVSVGAQAERRIHRLSRTAMRKLSCANTDGLTKEKQIELHTHASVVGAISLVTKPSKVNLIKAAVKSSESRLPVNKALEIFKT